MKEFVPFLIVIAAAWLGSLVFVVALMRAASRGDRQMRSALGGRLPGGSDAADPNPFRCGARQSPPGSHATAAPPEPKRQTGPRRPAPRLSVNPSLLGEVRPPRRYKVNA